MAVLDTDGNVVVTRTQGGATLRFVFKDVEASQASIVTGFTEVYLQTADGGEERVLHVDAIDFSSIRESSEVASALNRACNSNVWHSQMSGIALEVSTLMNGAGYEPPPLFKTLIGPVPFPPPEMVLDNLLVVGPNLIWAKGKTGKGFLACYISIELSRLGMAVGVIDWEGNHGEWDMRIRSLLAGDPDGEAIQERIKYFCAREEGMTKPFWDYGHRINKECERLGIDWVVLDSVGQASGTDLSVMDDKSALKFKVAIDTIGRPSATITHTSHQGAHALGTVNWENVMRSLIKVTKDWAASKGGLLVLTSTSVTNSLAFDESGNRFAFYFDKGRPVRYERRRVSLREATSKPQVEDGDEGSDYEVGEVEEDESLSELIVRYVRLTPGKVTRQMLRERFVQGSVTRQNFSNTLRRLLDSGTPAKPRRPLLIVTSKGFIQINEVE